MQGNVDPVILFAEPAGIEAAVRDVLQKAGPRGHILNLGHGVVVGASCSQHVDLPATVVVAVLPAQNPGKHDDMRNMLAVCCRHTRGVGRSHVPAQQGHQTGGPCCVTIYQMARHRICTRWCYRRWCLRYHVSVHAGCPDRLVVGSSPRSSGWAWVSV
jgi:Uroporphyrinogen decarboxylase (URO-D)